MGSTRPHLSTVSAHLWPFTVGFEGVPNRHLNVHLRATWRAEMARQLRPSHVSPSAGTICLSLRFAHKSPIINSYPNNMAKFHKNG